MVAGGASNCLLYVTLNHLLPKIFDLKEGINPEGCCKAMQWLRPPLQARPTETDAPSEVFSGVAAVIRWGLQANQDSASRCAPKRLTELVLRGFLRGHAFCYACTSRL
jgi:hypothetical protein